MKVWVLLRERSDHTTAHAVCADRASLERKLDSICRNNPYPLRQVGDNAWTIGPTEDEGFFGNKPLHLTAVEVSAYGLAVAGSATPTQDDELARLREFVVAHDAVEELIVDYTDDRAAYNAAVERFDRARQSVAGSATPTQEGDDDA